jgi:hypothetical protein
MAIAIACASGLSSAQAADYLNIKAIFPTNGLEYEHVSTGGLGLSVTGSYLPLPDSKFELVGVGIKKYFGQGNSRFFIAAYPQWMRMTLTDSHMNYDLDPETYLLTYSEAKATGSVSAFSMMGTFGFRGAWKHFNLAIELGAGYANLGTLSLSAIDPVTSQSVNWDTDVGFTGFLPALQLSFGYAF